MQTIQQVGIARHYRSYLERGAEQLSDFMRGAIEAGLAIGAVDYLAALDWQKSLAVGLEPLFDKYDAIVTPAAPGEAPKSLDSTGNPAFNGLWTLCGVPAVTLPLLQGPNGLPVGVQVVGRRGEDARLLRTARWLGASAARRGREDERDGSGMKGLDWIIAPVALISFALSVGTIIWFVPAPGLVAVSLLAIVLGAYDFLPHRDGARADESTSAAAEA